MCDFFKFRSCSQEKAKKSCAVRAHFRATPLILAFAVGKVLTQKSYLVVYYCREKLSSFEALYRLNFFFSDGHS